MTLPPDKLFRQGLEEYQKPAPGSAWDRIESGLDRKRNRGLWLKVAAGLILLVATSAIFFQLNQTESTIATVSKESGPVSSSERSVDPAKFKEFVAGEQLAVSSRDSVVNREASGVRREVKNGTKSSPLQSPVLSPQPAVLSPQSSVYSPHIAVTSENDVAPIEYQQAVSTEPAKMSIESKTITQVEITNEISTIDEASGSKGTSITYTADQVNAKFLKKETPPEATPEKKNTSGIQKVIDLALDLKNEGSVLGDIRDIKNELLSINIPSNKRETNK